MKYTEWPENIPNDSKLYQMATKYIKGLYISKDYKMYIPYGHKIYNDHKIDQRIIEYTNIFHYVKDLPKFTQIGLFAFKIYHLATLVSAVLHSVEILGLEGESTNEKWTIFLGYQGKFIMVLPSAARLGHLLLKIFFDSIKRVSLVLSADGNTIIFWPF
jgi:hypothetical protein